MSSIDERSACVVALRRVVKILGTQERLAHVCGVTPQAVSEWHRGAGRVPVEYVEKVSRETQIPPAAIRPDLRSILLSNPVL